MTHGRAPPSPSAPAGVRGPARPMFNGPLDLLLHLLREEQIEISDIPDRADRRSVPSRDPRAGPQPGRRLPRHGEPAGAAEGRSCCSRAAPEEEGWEDPAGRAGAASARVPADQGDRALDGRQADRRALQFRAASCRRRPSCRHRPLELDLLDLLEAVDRVIAAIPMPVLHRVVARPLNVEGATLRIERCFARSPEISFLEALGPDPRSRTCCPSCSPCSNSRDGAFALAPATAPFAAMVIRP